MIKCTIKLTTTKISPNSKLLFNMKRRFRKRKSYFTKLNGFFNICLESEQLLIITGLLPEVLKRSSD